MVFTFSLHIIGVCGGKEELTPNTYKHTLTLQMLTPAVGYLHACIQKTNKQKYAKIQLKDAFWKHMTMLMQFLNYHTKNISGILTIPLPISICENGNFCFREKEKWKWRSISLSACVLPALALSPIRKPLLLLCQVVLLSLNEIFALSAALTLRVEIVPTWSGFNAHNLPLSVSPCYTAT